MQRSYQRRWPYLFQHWSPSWTWWPLRTPQAIVFFINPIGLLDRWADWGLQLSRCSADGVVESDPNSVSYDVSHWAPYGTARILLSTLDPAVSTAGVYRFDWDTGLGVPGWFRREDVVTGESVNQNTGVPGAWPAESIGGWSGQCPAADFFAATYADIAARPF